MKLAIRGYQGGRLIFEDRVDVSDTEGLLPNLAQKHVDLLAGDAPHMIEVEFLEELDPLQRFFRFGTDPTRMVWPIGIDLSKKRSN